MSGKIIEIGKPTHYCDTPNLFKWKNRHITQNSKWQCDECQSIWNCEIEWWTKIELIKKETK